MSGSSGSLDKTTFLKGLKYLNAYYSNFNFDIKDDLKLEVWYSVFQKYENATYTELVKNYSVKNIFPPQSPSHLLDFAKTNIISQSLSADEAWEITVSNLRRLTYDFRRFYQEVDNEVISDTVKAMRTDFEGVLTENLPFVKKTFKNIYDEQLKKSVYVKLSEGQLKLSNQKQIALNDSVEVQEDE